MEIINKDLFIKKLQVKESRRLRELVEITDVDTVVTEDHSISNYEIENNEEEEDNTKIELKKSEILSRQQSTTSKSIIRLQWASFLIVAVHVVFAILYFIIFRNFLTDSDAYIDGINYLTTQLNYTISSANTLANILILNDHNYTSVSDKLGLVSYYINILKDNSLQLYDLNNKLNSLPLFTNNSSSNNNISLNFKYILSPNKYAMINLNYMEGLIELMSTIYTITVKYSTEMTFQTTEVYYFMYNSLNSYYLNSLIYINSYMNILLNLEISKTGLYIIIVTIVVYFILMIFLFSVLKFSLSMMNGILLEFLHITPHQAQFIVKKCENFVKNVRMNNMDEDEEDKEEDIDLKDVKRNKSMLKEKLSKSSTGYNYIIIIMIFVYLIMVLYFDIIYIVVLMHQQNLAQYIRTYNSSQYNNIIQKLSTSSIKVMSFDRNFLIMNKPAIIATKQIFDSLVSSKQNLDMQFQLQTFVSNNFTNIYNLNLTTIPLNISNLSLIQNFYENYSFNLVYSSYHISLNYLYDNLIISLNNVDFINDDHLNLASNLFIKLDFISDNILNTFMFLVCEYLYDDIKKENNFIWNFTVIWFSLYTTIIFVIYFIIWRPIEFRLAKDYTRTKLVVLLIPTKIIMKNPKIKDFLIKENLVSIKK